MGHNHIKTIEKLRSRNRNERKDKDRADQVYISMLLQPYANNVSEGEKNGKFLTWTGINNQQLLKHLPPIIATILGHFKQ